MRCLFIVFLLLLTSYSSFSQNITGEGTILWSQDFNDEPVNNSVSSSEIKAIIGEPMVYFNFDDNGQQQIIEYSTGDNAFSGRMDLGGHGGAGGWQIEKTLREDAGADSKFNNLTELWMSYNVWFPEGFSTYVEGNDGKMPGGFRGSYAFQDYINMIYADPSGTTPEDFIDGFLVRKYYDDGSPINVHKHLIYYKDMNHTYGDKSGLYYPDWPTNKESYLKLSTTPQNVAMRLKLNTDASTYDGVLEVYVNERLAYADYGKRFRVSDTVNIDWALWCFVPNSSQPYTLDDYLCVIDDLYLFTFSDGDSTVTGNEHIASPYTIDVPGWPKGEDLTNWGLFGQPTEQPDKEAPSIPSGIILTLATSSSLVFKWQSSTDNVGVDHYEIRLNDVFVAAVDSLSYAATDLNPNTRYAITISAFDEAGNFSPFSEEVFISTEAEVIDIPDNQPPTAPTGLKEQLVTMQSIELSWNPSTDNVAVIGYKIYSNNEVKGESASTSTTIENLKPGLIYVISISAFDEAGNESGKSSAIQVRTLNDDFTTNPTMPEVYIVDIQNYSENPSSLSELKSLGHTQVDAFGIMVTTGNQPVEEGDPIFAKQNLTEVESKGRVTEGLQLLYNFSDKEGSKVSEISGAGEPLDLHITHPLNSTWMPGQGLKLTDNTSLIYEGTPTRLLEALASTNEITIEAWISQSDIEQNGPARIVTLSNGTSSRAAMLGQEGNISSYNYIARLNTTNADLNGLPELATSTNFTANQSLHHVVYTRRSNGIEKMFVNGIKLSSGERTGDFSSWEEDYMLALGNEVNGERPWIGTFYLVAIYNQALSEEGVIQNFEAGFGKIRYTTELSELKLNTTYKLCPFVRTDQGIVYGEKKSFLVENVRYSGAIDSLYSEEIDSLYSEEIDSLYIAIYPNPSNGEFKLYVEYENLLSQPAFLRIADMSGKIIFGQALKYDDEYVYTEIDINLASQIKGGIYSVILIAGTNAVAQKLVILEY